MGRIIFCICLFLIQTVFAFASYQAKDYSDLEKMPGFSKSLIQMHLTLYKGYVTNTNLLLEKIESAKEPDFGALKRRLGWEYDGMYLHELYFENLGGKGAIDQYSPLYEAIEKQFGSYDAWRREFIETGMIRGIGWVILYRDPIAGQLINCWINEHDVGHLAGGTPLLVMDVFEHAYITQFGLDRKKYIETFFQNINWSVVEKRFNSFFN